MAGDASLSTVTHVIVVSRDPQPIFNSLGVRLLEKCLSLCVKRTRCTSAMA